MMVHILDQINLLKRMVLSLNGIFINIRDTVPHLEDKAQNGKISNLNTVWLTTIEELDQDQVLLGLTAEDKLDGTDHLLHLLHLLQALQPKMVLLKSIVFINPAALHSDDKVLNGKTSKVATRCGITMMDPL
jgi:hypothetical protein